MILFECMFDFGKAIVVSAKHTMLN